MLKTLNEKLLEDRRMQKIFAPKEPNFIVRAEADSEHIADSKKTKGVFSKFLDVEKLPNLGRERGLICITKDTADEVSDMLDRGTIKINSVWKISLDFDTDDPEGYEHYTKKTITTTREAKAYLRMLEEKTKKHYF